jgi:hypothetical protein
VKPHEKARLTVAVLVASGAAAVYVATEHWWPAYCYQPWRALVLLLSEASLVAAVVGLLVEFTHLRRVFEEQMASALVKLDYLRRLTPEALHDIGRTSYFALNEKVVENDFHKWQEYFRDLWERLTPLPIGPYRKDFKVRVDVEFLDTTEELATVVSKPASIGPLVRMTETIEYVLVSPTKTKDHPTYLEFDDHITCPLSLEEVATTKCVRYEVFVDGKLVPVQHTPIRHNDQELATTGQHPLGIRSDTVIKTVRTCLELQQGWFYTLYMAQPTFGFSVVLTTNKPRKLIHEVFSGKRQGKVVHKDDGMVLQFDVPGWLNPNDGFMIVPVPI